jgi:putative endopeptidase
MRRTFIAAVIVLTVLAIGCGSSRTAGSSTADAAPAPAFFAPHGFDLSAMDTSVKACDDFYRFAVGKWRETHPLPAQYSRYGRFEELAERNREVLHKILEEDAAMTNAAPGSAEQKVGDFYASCMNETAIEAAGVSPIQPELDRINGISDRASLLTELTHLHTAGFGPLFRVGGTNDQKNSKMIIASLGTGSLGLPDRDYYLRDDDRFKTIRNQYVDHVTKMLVLSGEGADQANSDAKRILDLESKLAASQLTRVEQRVPENTYHPTAVTELATMAPAVDWPTYLQNLGVTTTTLNVSQPKYIQTVSQLLNDVPLEDWKALLRWQVVDGAAPTLSSAFVSEDFNFGGRTLSGTKEQQERWKRCVRSADASIGQLLGQEYVRRNFTPEAKAKMSSLIDNLVAALHEDIPTLSWMGPETKAAALAKLNAFQRRIGYPEKWRDYSALTVSRASYASNIQAARAWAYHHNIERIGHADDPNEWGGFTPPTVNASYSPPQNNITFPAGILQPPFFDPNADDAYNYGGIGTVIGHEMTHGFDDQGAKYDAQGNLRNWFTPEDLKSFTARTDCVANEYSEFNVAQGININGKLVNGESVADLGGATIALRAYEKSLQGKQRQTIDGFTPEQRFFLGFAQVWGENMSPQEATRRALTDPHAQGPFRVNGTVQNMPEFWKAYNCTDSDKMVREAAKRCSIW